MATDIKKCKGFRVIDLKNNKSLFVCNEFSELKEYFKDISEIELIYNIEKRRIVNDILVIKDSKEKSEEPMNYYAYVRHGLGLTKAEVSRLLDIPIEKITQI